jgi:hypothetical protein
VETVLRHEVVHVLLHQYAKAAGPYVPRWLHEGLAQRLAGGTYLGASEEDIVFHAKTGNLLAFSRLSDGFPRGAGPLRTAYAQSDSFVAFLLRERSLDTVLVVAARCGPSTSFADAWFATTGAPLATVEQRWVEYLVSGAGAAWRVLLASCFGLTMVAFLPLAVLAAARRWNRDHAVRQALDRAEAEPPPPEELDR